MADYLALDVAVLEREIRGLMDAFGDAMDGDEALVADMIEGETNAHAVIGRLLDHRFEAKAMQESMKARREDLATRASRWARREDFASAAIMRVMALTGLDKLTTPEATISVTKGRESIEIIDVNELPQGFYVNERKPDRTAIGAALMAGQSVPGAQMRQGEPSITVRTK